MHINLEHLPRCTYAAEDGTLDAQDCIERGTLPAYHVIETSLLFTLDLVRAVIVARKRRYSREECKGRNFWDRLEPDCIDRTIALGNGIRGI
jgi:hypothetical protein